MTIETKFNKGDCVKYWDNSQGWRYGNILKITIIVICSVPDIQYKVDFSDEFHPKDVRQMPEYKLLNVNEYDD